jgi:hypothetical protein
MAKHLSLLTLGLLIALLINPSAAFSFPRSYAREHPAYCAEAWAQRTNARSLCASAAFCTQHRNDDRISRLECDPYVSKADRTLEIITLSHAWLKTAGDAAEADTLFPCHHPAYLTAPADRALPEDQGGMLPAKMKTAKLGICAAISVWTFPVTIVKVGIGADGTGIMEITWNRNGTGPRETHSVKLSLDDTTHLLIAVNRSDFWRLPHQGGHIGATDGEVATVEAAMAGRKNRVTDTIGDYDAVDLSFLVNALNEIIAKHWQHVPM